MTGASGTTAMIQASIKSRRDLRDLASHLICCFTEKFETD